MSEEDIESLRRSILELRGQAQGLRVEAARVLAHALSMESMLDSIAGSFAQGRYGQGPLDDATMVMTGLGAAIRDGQKGYARAQDLMDEVNEKLRKLP